MKEVLKVNTRKLSLQAAETPSKADEVIGAASGQNILQTSYVYHPEVDSSASCVG